MMKIPEFKTIDINLVPFGDPATARQARDIACESYLDAVRTVTLMEQGGMPRDLLDGVSLLVGQAHDSLERRDYAGCYANAMMLLAAAANGFEPVAFNLIQPGEDADGPLESLPVTAERPRVLH